MENKYWAFNKLPNTASLVGVPFSDFESRMRLAKALPRGVCLLKHDEVSYGVASIKPSVLDIASVCLANSLLASIGGADPLALKDNADRIAVLSSIKSVNTVKLIANKLLLHFGRIREAGVNIAELADKYQYANFDFEKGEMDKLFDDTQRAYMATRHPNTLYKGATFDLAVMPSTRAIQNAKPCVYDLSKVVAQWEGAARNMAVHSFVANTIPKSAAFPSLYPNILRYCSRSLFASRLATYAMGVALNIAARVVSVGHDAAYKYVVDIIAKKSDCLAKFSTPYDELSTADVAAAWSSLFVSLFESLGMKVDGDTLAKTFDEDLGLHELLLVYCVIFAACAHFDARTLALTFNEPSAYSLMELCLLLTKPQTETTADDLRKVAIDLLDTSAGASVATLDTEQPGRLKIAGTDDEKEIEYAQMIEDQIRVLLESSAPIEGIREACHELISRNVFACVEFQSSDFKGCQAFPVPVIFNRLRIDSEKAFRCFFPGGNVFNLPHRSGVDVRADAALRSVIAFYGVVGQQADAVLNAAFYLGGSRSPFPGFEDLIKESDTWQPFVFPSEVIEPRGTFDLLF